jgi:hypothetical protein
LVGTPTISNEGYTCMYQKSQCSEEGQIVYSNGSAIEDRTCTCDYRAGYAFLREPAGKCFCSPSVEDCSCYKKTCTDQVNIVHSQYFFEMNQGQDNPLIENRHWK